MRKAWSEVQRGHAERVVMLVPARVGQAWYHQTARPFGRVEPIVGRVQFVPPPGVDGRGTSAFEDSIVIIFERPIEAGDFR